MSLLAMSFLFLVNQSLTHLLSVKLTYQTKLFPLKYFILLYLFTLNLNRHTLQMIFKLNMFIWCNPNSQNHKLLSRAFTNHTIDLHLSQNGC